MKLFLLGVFGAFTMLFLFLTFGRDLQPTGASPAATASPIIVSNATVDPFSRQIYYDLNMSIEQMEMSTKFNMLEHIYGASYQVVYVELLPENGVPATLRVHVRCECARDAECCSSLHTFVVAMQAMDNENYEQSFLTAVPTTVSIMEVSTFNHTDPQGKMIVPWSDVKTFLESELENPGFDGVRLWYEVTPQP
jgi:hypothetical protein